MILLVGGQKGGGGKTTISTNIAGYLATQGKDVLLVDANSEQANASGWAAKRNEDDELPGITCVEKKGNLVKDIKKLAEKYDEIVIDTGGQDSKEFRTGLCVADVLLTPFEPSQYAVDTVANVITLIEAAMDINEDLKTYAVISRAPTHAKLQYLIDETRELLGNFEIFNLCETNVHGRTEFVHTAQGTCAEEGRDPKAKAEIRSLVAEIY